MSIVRNRAAIRGGMWRRLDFDRQRNPFFQMRAEATREQNSFSNEFSLLDIGWGGGFEPPYGGIKSQQVYLMNQRAFQKISRNRSLACQIVSDNFGMRTLHSATCSTRGRRESEEG